MSGAATGNLTGDGPLWRRIVRALGNEIGPGGLRPGSRLPTEAELAGRFGVNRHTVRRAMEELARAGLVRVEQGRGAFVADDVLPYEVRSRTRFSEWVRRRNREPGGEVLQVREAAAGAAVAAGLELAPGEMVAQMERLGLADGVPVSLGSHYFPSARLPGILDALRNTGSVTASLLAVGVEDYARRSTRVSTRLPTAAEASLLRVGRTRPILCCENTNVDAVGNVVEFCLARHPGTRVQLVFEP